MYSARPPYLIARAKQMDLLTKKRTAATQSKGSFVCVMGETGYGKTAVLETFEQDAQKTTGTYEMVRVECTQPIGTINIGAIQPMQPFVKVLETLMERSSMHAKKKLAMNIGLSILGMIPIVGDVFAATKEVMRDLREYKSDKVKQESGEKKGEQVVHEFYTAITSYAAQHPLIMMIDDAQWMDAQSVELLNRFLVNISQLPVLIVLSFQRATTEAQNSALAAWLHEHIKHDDITFTDLSAFTNAEVGECCTMYLPNYKKNVLLEQWLINRTAGIPSTVCEYLNYFQKHPPFKSDGTLDDDFLNSNIVPASLQAMFSKNIEQLNEEDRNLLGLCAAEGREFTVFVISKLMNTDVLTAVKRLKSLQVRTGIIRSLGPHARYGVRTTIYEFTQALHYTYFHSTLEFEEKIELHERIARILQLQHDEIQNEELRKQIAPFIAAHSLEAGDQTTARSMLLESAHAAEEAGSKDVLKEAYDLFEGIDGDVTNETTRKEEKEFRELLNELDITTSDDATVSELRPPGVQTPQTDMPDVGVVRDDIFEFFFRGEYEQAALRAQDFLESNGHLILPGDRILLMAMAARAHTENGRYTHAQELCNNASQLLTEHNDTYSKAYLLNALGVLAHKEGHSNQAWAYLQQAAQLSMELTDEVKLLTVSNVALLLREINPRQARAFERVAKQLSQSMHFTDFYHDVFAVH
ncbi:MAG: AAA family ATPase [Bacteriodetes bacterium]|nr:AAA family ATPase [Bacteroidota bacterium]